MNKKLNRFCFLFALAIVIFSASATWATVITFPDFSSTAGLTLNGNAATAVTSDGTVLRLVPATTGQSGSAFSSATINASTFSTSFEFRLTNAGGITDGTDVGADGFVFVVQPVSSSIGGAGGGLGYAGISPSVGAEFDTFRNAWDPDSNHLGVDTNGNVTSLATQFVAPNFDDGNLWFAWIDYNGTTLEVRTNETGTRPTSPLLSFSLDIPTIIGTNTAFVGFTAGTGSAFANHDIISWEYRDTFNPIGVPEPSTILLLGAGLAGVGILRRRFKK